MRDTVTALANLLDLPMRRIRLRCVAEQPFALALGATLGPSYGLRGLIGAAITESSTELARRLFKVPSIDGFEAPTMPWRLDVAALHAREVEGLFDLSVDLLGEEPCGLADQFVDAVRLAGSGASYRDAKQRLQRFSIVVTDEKRRVVDRVGFRVEQATIGETRLFSQAADRWSPDWVAARRALLVFRSLTILTQRIPGRDKGVPLATMGDLDIAARIGDTLRRWIVLGVSTRFDPASRSRRVLAESLATCARTMDRIAADCPLRCEDVMTVPAQWDAEESPPLQGLVGSILVSGGSFAEWTPALMASEVIGMGESTALGAGQVRWLPASDWRIDDQWSAQG